VSEIAGRLLGVDLGDARIGLALSDPLGIIAQPLDTVRAVGARVDANAICRIVEEHEVTTVVIGLPLLMSGGEGSRAVAARTFAERLRRRLHGVSVELWDERLTSVSAQRTMISGGARRARRKQKVDTMAAMLILQSFLDAQAADHGEAE